MPVVAGIPGVVVLGGLPGVSHFGIERERPKPVDIAMTLNRYSHVTRDMQW